jgi:ribosomal protein L29
MDLSKNAVKVAGGKEKNLKVARNIKKEIAQILTIIKSK